MPDSFYKAPDVSELFACPNCKRLLSVALDQCPHCRELIDEKQKLIGTAVHVTVTQACSLANTISTGDPIVILLLGLTAISFLFDFTWLAGITIITGVMVLAAIVRWRRLYGWLPVEDPDLVAAKREMKKSLRLWIAFVCLEVVIIAYTYRFRSL